MKLARVLLAVLVALAVSACAEEDTEAPPAPNVDPVQSPTSFPTQWITGSAEYGSTVTINGGVEEVTTTADPFTAEFRAEVQLNADAENLLSVTATDKAGNESAPTEVTIAHEAARPESLWVELVDPVISTDNGTVTATAQIGNDEAGISLADHELNFSIADYAETIEAQTVTTDDSGRATVTFDGLTTVGSGKVVVEATANAELGARSADFVVTGGQPANVELQLITADDGPSDALTGVSPLTDIIAELVVEDQAANEIDAPIRLVTDAPGAFITGHTISGVPTAGTWTVAANVVGTGITATATFEIVPDVADSVAIWLDSQALTAGETVEVTTEVTDAFGNTIDASAEPVTLTLDQSPFAPDPAISGNQITIESPARLYTVKATLDSNDTITATADLDIAPAAPASGNFAFGLSATDVAAGTDVDFTYSVQDEYGNDVEGARVDVAINSRDALINDNGLDGGTISLLEKAGQYTVTARVHGTDLIQSETLTVNPAAGANIALGLSDDAIQAGESVTTTSVVTDAYGNLVTGPDAAVTLSVSPTPAAPVAAIQGNQVTIESPANTYTITATLDADNTVMASADVWVGPAAPDANAFDFQFTTAEANTGGTYDVVAGTDVDYTYTVEDAYGNPVPSAVVDVQIDAPQPFVSNDGSNGGTISLLHDARLYTVSARVRNTNILVTRDLEVIAGPATDIALLPSTDVVPDGDPVVLDFQVTDSFGNEVPNPSITVSTDDTGAIYSGDMNNAANGDQITFSQEGTWNLMATETSANVSDSTYIRVAKDLDFIAPTVSVVSPSGGDEFAPGSPVTVTVDANDNEGLLKVGIRTRGIVEKEDVVYISGGTQSTTERFTFVIPARRYGTVTIYAFAIDESGNEANAQPVTIISQHPSVNNLTCPSCTSIVTAAAGFEEGGVFRQGDEGGIRAPGEIVVGNGGEIFVALMENIQLQRSSGFVGTDQEEQYISLILPDGSVEAFATLTAGGNIDNQEVYGLAYDSAAETLYASLGFDANGTPDSRVVAYGPTGTTDPFADAPGDREAGLFFAAGKLLATDIASNPDRVYAADQSSLTTIFNGAGDTDALLDVCGDDATLFMTRPDELHSCQFNSGAPSSCANPTLVSDDPAIAGQIRSCALSPNGRVIVANTSTGEILSVDPTGQTGSNATLLVSGLTFPVGVAIDPLTGDLLVSDTAQHAVFRFQGSF